MHFGATAAPTNYILITLGRHGKHFKSSLFHRTHTRAKCTGMMTMTNRTDDPLRRHAPAQPLTGASFPMAAASLAFTPKPNDLLRRHILARALTDAGFPTAAATLASKATRGGGPPFRSYGRIPLYRWGDALEWAESRLSAPRQSTSEAVVT